MKGHKFTYSTAGVLASCIRVRTINSLPLNCNIFNFKSVLQPFLALADLEAVLRDTHTHNQDIN